MIVCIEYSGRLKEGALEELERRLKTVVARHEWEMRWMDFNEFPILRRDGDDHTLHHGPCSGFSIDFHPESEPVRFYMEPDRRMNNFVRLRHCPIQTHIAIVDMLREVHDLFEDFNVDDEGQYWQTGSTAYLNRRKEIDDACGKFRPSNFSREFEGDCEFDDEDEDDPSGMPRIGYGFEYLDPDHDDTLNLDDQDDEAPF